MTGLGVLASPRAPSTGEGRLWSGATIAILAAVALCVPAVAYQMSHFRLGWYDTGIFTRAAYNLFDFGRLASGSDGSNDFFVCNHFEVFLFALAVPVRVFGTQGFVWPVTAAVVLAAGYVFALARELTRSWWTAMLCAAAYVFNPYTSAIVLSYHIETFAILFLLAFAYHELRSQSVRAWVALLLAFTVKEDIWIYGIVVALLVARRDRWKHAAAYAGAAVCYYAIAILYIGGSWYPTANYFNTFFELGGHKPSKLQIVQSLAARWREYLPLLFTGPGLLFQLSLLFMTIFGGWRYLVTCGVMLLWLLYPGGPPRSDLEFYYSYAPLLVSFVVLPYSLVTLKKWSRGRTARRGQRTVMVAMGLVLAVCVVMHVPGWIPAPIANLVDHRIVFANTNHVNVRVVRHVIDQYLAGNNDDVLAQYFIMLSIPQHRRVYVTTNDRVQFMAGQIRPKYVLLDLGAADPWIPWEETLAMARFVRLGGAYRPRYDANRVLLYERVR